MKESDVLMTGTNINRNNWMTSKLVSQNDFKDGASDDIFT